LQRNRLLAAMTGATVVVEAGHRSGALNTATHARALDRPLGAVPGPITSPSSAGCHRLLREPDVSCITSAADVVHLLAPSLVSGEPFDALSRARPSEIRVRDGLGRRQKSAVEVAVETGVAEVEVRATLAVLELKGLAEEREYGWVRASP
jgi:DNA processing protein